MLQIQQNVCEKDGINEVAVIILCSLSFSNCNPAEDEKM